MPRSPGAVRGYQNTTGDELTRIRTSDEHHIPALVTTADEDPYGALGAPVLDELTHELTHELTR
jgi:hypothetical protein